MADLYPARRAVRGPRNIRVDRCSPESEPAPTGARIRVDNLHYDLTEDDLDGLFSEIGPVQSLSIRFDRAGRSSGTAFVTYTHISDARHAIREFDGANANGQPIRLTLLPSGPSGAVSSNGIGIRGRAAPAPRNPFDTAIKPGRSLFERIEEPRGGSRSKGRSRSRSPGAPRRTNISKPPPDGVDRYVPSGSNSRRRSRSRSPVRRRRSPVRGRRGGGGRERSDGQGFANGRPRKTQEELDKEMEDYWGGQKKDEGVNGNGVVQNGNATANGFGGAVFAADGTGPVAQAVVVDDGDIDMIE
ncbi:hypothetical protein G7Y79_00002g006450 [Physcia stellaris]|nr:hypothetical protein G7Y79_00002g006450 [Physcia stellaris]